MYFIDKEKDLVGKRIIFTHFAKFADYMTIVTEDKGIFVCEKDDEEITILNEPRARRYVLKSVYLRGELSKLKVISYEEIKEYERRLEEKRLQEQKVREKERAEIEYREYQRLKAKFEK